MLRINIGCGQSPTTDWKNYDNSLSVRLANMPVFTGLMTSLKLLSKQQQDFIFFAKEKTIYWADAVNKIPEIDNSVDVVYSCHMLEHLDRESAKQFLKETHRVLKNDGVLRIAVPDIRYHINNYVENNDADQFMQQTLLGSSESLKLIDKLKYLIVGNRNHQWMYDGKSLCKLLTIAGFTQTQILEPGKTNIHEPGALDLEERTPESVFVEATKR